MTRDDFPCSLQPYTTPAAGGGLDAVTWRVFLYRIASDGERTWLRENGFILRGRTWEQAATPAKVDAGP